MCVCVRQRGREINLWCPFRELELEMASSRPIFSGAPVRLADPSELYPNVYDSMAKAKLTSAYMDGKPVSQSVSHCATTNGISLSDRRLVCLRRPRGTTRG